MSAVYRDFSLRLTQWESKEKHLKDENNSLRADSDDSKLQLKRIQEVLDAGDDGDAITQQLVRLGTLSTHVHTHTHTHSLSHTIPLSLSHTHTLTLSHSLPFSLRHTHTHTHTCILIHTDTLTKRRLHTHVTTLSQITKHTRI